MDQKQPLQGFSAEKAMAMAQSEAGKKLLSLLQETNGDQLRRAMEQAATGNYEDAKRTVSSLLSSQEAKALMKEMRE